MSREVCDHGVLDGRICPECEYVADMLRKQKTTLRDQMAMHCALAAGLGMETNDVDFDVLASRAYKLADSMLRAREVGSDE